MFTLYLIKTGGGLLVFFDDELTTFRNKNDRFICNVKKLIKQSEYTVRKVHIECSHN